MALVAVSLMLAAGCGGDDDSGGTAETTAASSGAERLTPDQWSEYRTAGEEFAAARKAAEAKLDSCPRSATGELDEYEACVGASLDALEDAATALGQTLTGFIGTVSGACETSLNAFTQYVSPFVASVDQLQKTLAADNVAGLANTTSSLQTALAGGQEESKSFERDCSPL
jgi:hypothetical protein